MSESLFYFSVSTSSDQPLIIPNFTEMVDLRPLPPAMRTGHISAATVQGLILNVAASGLTVDIDAGRLGLCTNNPQGAYFKLVPYAEPPIAELRFAPPQPHYHSNPK